MGSDPNTPSAQRYPPGAGASRHIEGFIPFGEGAEALADVDFRAEAVVPFEDGAVRVGDRHIARLHWHEGLMGVEVVIRRQDAGADELLLEGRDVVEEVLREASADVVDGVWRDREAVLLLRCAAHDADVEAVGREELVDERLVCDVAADEDPAGFRGLRGLLDLPEAVLLQLDRVVVGHAVDADDRRALRVAQQPRAEVRADEARCARDEDGFSVEGYSGFLCNL